MRAYLVSCIMECLIHALKIRGYQTISFKEIEDTLEIEADGLKAYVYHLDLFNPQFDGIDYAAESVLRQLESEKLKG